jgi:hypothetical protein
VRLKHLIDTITSKLVLILGRFTPERKVVLDAIRNELRKRDYVPALFDFEKPSNKTTVETVSALTHMARLVVADLTDARSVLQELQALVPTNPSVPIQPLILNSQTEPGMFDFFRMYPWVLGPYLYEDQDRLLAAHGGGDRASRSEDEGADRAVGPQAIRPMSIDWTFVGKTLAVGGALFYGVQKFFDVVGDKLNNDTRLEIAVWLLDRKKVSPAFQKWSSMFADVFDRVFGSKHLSWKTFGRSCIATLISCSLCSLFFAFAYLKRLTLVPALFGATLLFSFDYLSLLETRYILRIMSRSRSIFGVTLLLVIDLLYGRDGSNSPLRFDAGPYSACHALYGESGLCISDPGEA